MSAFDKALWAIGNYQTFNAEEALTTGQLVQLGTAGNQVKKTDNTANIPVGIAYDNAAAGAECTIVTPYPIVPCIAGGTVTRGSFVQPQTHGSTYKGSVVDVTLAPVAAGATIGIVGLAIDTGSAGQLVRVLMCGAALVGARA